MPLKEVLALPKFGLSRILQSLLAAVQRPKPKAVARSPKDFEECRLRKNQLFL